jgi:hypothetical protein
LKEEHDLPPSPVLVDAVEHANSLAGIGAQVIREHLHDGPVHVDGIGEIPLNVPRRGV